MENTGNRREVIGLDNIKEIVGILEVIASKIGEQKISKSDFDSLNLEDRLDYYLRMLDKDGLIRLGTEHQIVYSFIEITTKGLLFLSQNK